MKTKIFSLLFTVALIGLGLSLFQNLKLSKSLRAESDRMIEVKRNYTATYYTLKQTVVNDPFGNPLDNFFDAPEFWEDVFEDDPFGDGTSFPPPTDCEKKCLNQFNIDWNLCQTDQCRTNVYNSKVKCTRLCAFGPIVNIEESKLSDLIGT